MGKNEKKATLAEAYPELVAQWHPTKNGDLTPDMVTCGSGKKVYWIFPFDDPKTGKHFDFEWPAKVVERVNGAGCPFLIGKDVWPGYNDLATKYPNLAKEWHPTLNGDLTPDKVLCFTKKKAYWYFPYDAPETGQHFDFVWHTRIADRVKGGGCPYLSGKEAWPGYNDLATKRPDLAAEWHPTKNGDLTPDQVVCGSNKRVWWRLPFDDPESGKHFDFEWKTRVADRVAVYTCPFLSGKKAWPGYNDLATKCPDLAAQWHPTKNGDWTPDQVTCTCVSKAWWYLPFDDPETGEHFDFEWEAKIYERVQGSGCPYISGNAVWPGYNDLASKFPALAKEWHPTLNGGLTPDKVIAGSVSKAWWYLPFDDPETGKHFDFQWDAQIASRTKGCGCPYIAGKEAWPGYNDLATKRPDLAAEWHPTLNGDLTPEQVTCGMHQKVHWILSHDDPESGKHFDFVWEAEISNRVSGDGCPYLSGHAVWPGYNDLATKRPDLAAQWHPTKNGDLTPSMVTCYSQECVWWFFPYDDPETGKHFDFEWETEISGRSAGNGCPFLSGRDVWPGFNDLATKRPDLAAQWHPTRNGSLTPEMVTVSSTLKVRWLLPYDDPKTGRRFNFTWTATIASRSQGVGCPFLVGKAVWIGFNDLASQLPDLAKEWHPTKNKRLTPEKVVCHCRKKVWWYLPYDDPETGVHYDFEWKASITSRSSGTGCPYLSGHEVYPGFNDLATKRPDIAAQWHPTKNGRLTAEMVTCGSGEKVWWIQPYDDPETGKHFDFEWPATVASRAQGSGCPYLSGREIYPGFNDFATKHPDIAVQWHPTKNGDLTPSMVTCHAQDRVWWLLPYDDPDTGKHFDFEWPATVASRAQGSGCPYLSGHEVYPGFNDLATKRPDLAAQWHPTKNGELTPEMVTTGSITRVRWFFPYDDPETGKHFDFEWSTPINSRNRGKGCPFLSGYGVWPGFNDLGSCYPDIAAEWHPTKNRRLIPSKVYKATTKKAWWKCSRCGHEWYASVKGRTIDGSSCPRCRRTVYYNI